MSLSEFEYSTPYWVNNPSETEVEHQIVATQNLINIARYRLFLNMAQRPVPTNTPAVNPIPVYDGYFALPDKGVLYLSSVDHPLKLDGRKAGLFIKMHGKAEGNVQEKVSLQTAKSADLVDQEVARNLSRHTPAQLFGMVEMISKAQPIPNTEYKAFFEKPQSQKVIPVGVLVALSAASSSSIALSRQ